ncbi:hypothetical protein [Rhizobium straminoryzae]|nr:hypothetical protein [Rhizobium straminoryzae]
MRHSSDITVVGIGDGRRLPTGAALGKADSAPMFPAHASPQLCQFD